MPRRTNAQVTREVTRYFEDRGVGMGEIPTSTLETFITTLREADRSISVNEVAQSTGISNFLGEREQLRTRIGGVSVNLQDLRPRSVRVEGARDTMRLSQADLYEQLQVTARHEPTPNPMDEILQMFYHNEPVPVRVEEVTEEVERPSAPTYHINLDELDSMPYAPYRPQRVQARPSRPRRSENDMMMEIVRGETFPRPSFKNWSSDRELNDIIDDWYRHIEYRDQWIFARREREGFNRRNIGQFHLDDVMARITKRKGSHPLDTEHSTFYDWKLGGTDWILRLELFKHYEDGVVKYFLISRYVHKPSNVEIKYDVKYWSENAQMFKSVVSIFSETRNNETIFDRHVGNINNNPFDEEWYGDDECYDSSDDDDYYDDYENDEGDTY